MKTNRLFNIMIEDLLLLGNLIFGAFAAIFWTLFMFAHMPITMPLVLNGIQVLFLISQLLYGKFKKYEYTKKI